MLLRPAPETFEFVWPPHGAGALRSEFRSLVKRRTTYEDTVLVRLAEERLVSPARMRAIRARPSLRAAIERRIEADPSTRPFLEEFAARPAAGAERLAALLGAFAADVLAPTWGAVDERLRSEVAMREELLRRSGVAAVMRTLSPQIAASSESGRCTLRIEQPGPTFALSDDSAVALTPSFSSPDLRVVLLRRRTGIECRIVFPVRAHAPASRRPADADALARALAAAGSPVRLRILDLLRRGALSTRELAGFLGTSEPLTSKHLATLAAGGLVRKRRSGYFMLYELHPDGLLLPARALAALAGERSTDRR